MDDSFTTTPDALNPGTGSSAGDVYVFDNVFQELVEFTGENSTQGVVVPVLAQNYSVSNNSQTFTFNLRPDVTFSDGTAMNATAAWFSFVRNLILGQYVVAANFIFVTEYLNASAVTGMQVPWGLLNAIQNVTGLPTTTNYALAQQVLNNMLSNFNVHNATQMAIMTYPDQAYVVSGPLIFTIHEIQSYPFLLPDIAQGWAEIIDPAFVDAHGGVQANSANAYFNSNGGPGTGPYEIASVGAGFSDVILKANPTYWALTASNYPVIAEPPKIPVIIINFALISNDRLEDFATNQAQISYVEFPLLGQMWSAYKYKQYATFNQVFDNFGLSLGTYWMSMNVQKYPTNITSFRDAIVHAINYTQLLDQTQSFNGTVYAANYVGPMNPTWGKYYDPGNLSNYDYNTTEAINYMNQAGMQGGFSVTLPNGSTIGNTNDPNIAPISLVYAAPISCMGVYQSELEIIQADLSQIGLPLTLQPEASSVLDTYTTPQASPNMQVDCWGPDWPDPVLQQMYDLMTPIALKTNWMNLTNVNNLLASLVYDTNQTSYLQGIEQGYQIDYNEASMAWLPVSDLYLLVQPYVHGLVFSPYVTVSGQYWYNTLYYSDVS